MKKVLESTAVDILIGRHGFSCISPSRTAMASVPFRQWWWYWTEADRMYAIWALLKDISWLDCRMPPPAALPVLAALHGDQAAFELEEEPRWWNTGTKTGAIKKEAFLPLPGEEENAFAANL